MSEASCSSFKSRHEDSSLSEQCRVVLQYGLVPDGVLEEPELLQSLFPSGNKCDRSSCCIHRSSEVCVRVSSFFCQDLIHTHITQTTIRRATSNATGTRISTSTAKNRKQQQMTTAVWRDCS